MAPEVCRQVSLESALTTMKLAISMEAENNLHVNPHGLRVWLKYLHN